MRRENNFSQTVKEIVKKKSEAMGSRNTEEDADAGGHGARSTATLGRAPTASQKGKFLGQTPPLAKKGSRTLDTPYTKIN